MQNTKASFMVGSTGSRIVQVHCVFRTRASTNSGSMSPSVVTIGRCFVQTASTYNFSIDRYVGTQRIVPAVGRYLGSG